MGIILQIAAQNLIAAKRRSALLGLALMMVTMLLVLLLALSQGLSQTIIEGATTLSSGHLNVAGFFKATANDAAPILMDRQKIREVVEKSTPGVELVIDRHRGWARVISETSSLQAGLTGVDIANDPRLLSTLRVLSGDITKLGQPGAAMIFAAQAKRLEVEVGDNLTITVETLAGLRNTAEVTVVAIAKDVGLLSNWSLFLNRESILELYRLKPETTGAVMVYLDDIERAPAVMEQLRASFADAGFGVMDHEPLPFFMKFEKVAGEDWLGQRVDITVWKDEVSFLNQVLSTVNAVSFFLVSVLLVIIVVGIMNSMVISVRERTREIGTIRAIGMGRFGVMALFMSEAIILSFLSTGLGAALGALIAIGVDAAQIQVSVEAVQAVLMTDTINLVVEPSSLVAAVLGFTTLTALAALWPSLRAARLQPVEAMHTVS